VDPAVGDLHYHVMLLPCEPAAKYDGRPTCAVLL